jgi:hypothetical protein
MPPIRSRTASPSRLPRMLPNFSGIYMYMNLYIFMYKFLSHLYMYIYIYICLHIHMFFPYSRRGSYLIYVYIHTYEYRCMEIFKYRYINMDIYIKHMHVQIDTFVIIFIPEILPDILQMYQFVHVYTLCIYL